MLGSIHRFFAVLLVLGAVNGIPASECVAQTKPGLVFNVSISPTLPDLVSYEFRDGEDSQELQFRNIVSNQTFDLRRTAATSTSGSFQLPGLGSRTLKAYSGDLDWRAVKGGDVTWFAYVSGEEGGFRVRLNYVGANGTFGGQSPLSIPGDPAATAPRWSPNGRHLAFVSDSGALFVVWNIDRLLRGSPAGVVATKISAAGSRVLFPTWSPKGGLIAYQTERELRGSRRYVIEALPVDQQAGTVTGAAVLLTSLPLENAYRPSWSADERFIAFYMDRGTSDATRDLDIGVSELLRDANTGRLIGGEVRGRRSRRLAENVVVNDAHGPSWARVEGEAMAGGRKPLDGLLYPSRNATRGNPVMFVTLERWIDGRPESETNLELSSGWDSRNHKSVVVREAAQNLRFAYAASQGGGEELRTRDVPATWSNPVVVADNAAPAKPKGAESTSSTSGSIKSAPSIPATVPKVEKETVAGGRSGGNFFDLAPGVMQFRQGRSGTGLLILAGGAGAGYVMMSGLLNGQDDNGKNCSRLNRCIGARAVGGAALGMAIWNFGLGDGWSHASKAKLVSVGVQPMLAPDGRWASAPSLALRLPLGH